MLSALQLPFKNKILIRAGTEPVVPEVKPALWVLHPMSESLRDQEVRLALWDLHSMSASLRQRPGGEAGPLGPAFHVNVTERQSSASHFSIHDQYF